MDNNTFLVRGCALLTAGAVVGIYAIYRITGQIREVHRDRFYLSHVLSRGALKYAIPAETLRGQFTDLSLARFAPSKNHTHAHAASDRSAASSFADRYGAVMGLTPYFVQCSRADERSGRQGSRSYYWSKDLTVAPAKFQPPAHSIHVMIDVDHYIDMPAYLVDEFAPTLLYTFQPEQVCRISADYSYTFDADSRVEYRVTGGGTFSHLVWNYGLDHLLLTKTWFGFPYKVAAYLVDRRATSDDHELVLLTPVAKWSGWRAVLTALLAGCTLKRLSLHHNGFLRLETHRKDGVFRSTAKVGSYAHALIGAGEDDAIAAIARTSKIDLTMPQVMSFVDGDRVAAAPLLEYHRSNVPRKPDVVFPVAQSVHRYQFEPDSFDPSAKPAMTAFMSPFIHECYSPDLTVENERRCIQARIKDVKSDVEMTPFLSKAMLEFVAQFLPESHMMDPTDEDELYARQDRPSQRRILEESGPMLPVRMVKMFQKKEAYTEPKDPRPISTINGVDKAAYSKYTYPLSDHIKRQAWYAFGKSPIDIAQRVVNVLTDANTAVNTDLSRFDGRVSQVLRELEKLVLVRAFRHKYHAEILELHRSQFNLPAVGTFGTRYETGYARASGSPETAAFNSLANAFMAFLTIRMTRYSGAFVTPEVAYRRLGIYGGDDGLTADVDADTYTRACALVGQKLAVEPVHRGNSGIKFLARVYGPNVWFGDPNSCCDLPRQLSKFHATVTLPVGVTPVMKLLEKARAFYLSDKNTPILGEFVSKVVQVHGHSLLDSESRNLNIWNADLPADLQYPNEPASWMVDYSRQSIPDFDYDRFKAWLDGANSLAALLSPPLCAEPKPAKSAVPVVVDLEVVGDERPKRSGRGGSHPEKGKARHKPEGGREKTPATKGSKGRPAADKGKGKDLAARK